MKCLSEMMVFARVVESGGFSAAARALGTTTSAISRNITRLEAHIGGRLLNRTTRALSVTELGREVHAACVAIHRTSRELDALADDQGGAPSGHLKVGVPGAYGQAYIIPQLPRFMKRYPDLSIQLELVEQVPDVVGESYDLAICTDAAPPASLTARALSRCGTVLVASPAYLARAGTPAHPADLDAHTVICARTAASGASWTMRLDVRDHRVSPRSRMLANDDGTIVCAASEGMGIGLVTDYAARHALQSGQLVQVLADWRIEGAIAPIVHALYAPARRVPKKTEAFIDFFSGAAPVLQLAA